MTDPQVTVVDQAQSPVVPDAPPGFPRLWVDAPGHVAAIGCSEAELAALAPDLPVAHLAHNRKWLCPFTGDEMTVAEALDLLALWHERLALADRPIICLGMSLWKQRTVADFLTIPGANPPRFMRDAAAAVKAAKATGARIIVWSTRQKPDVEALCTRAQVELWRMEDGFVRSAGLGSNLVPACSHSIDRTGIYYDGRLPSDLEHAIATDTHPPRMLARADKLIALMVEKNVSKYSIGGAFTPPWVRGDKPVILVPGQVSDDQSILTSAMYHSNLDFLKAVRAAEPNAILVYKPHPDVLAGNRKGGFSREEALKHADHVVEDAPIGAVLGHVDQVHTQTSLVGFEALLRGLPVTTWGMPFYAGWGLTRDNKAISRRQSKVSLQALVASALIGYPYYRDPVTGLPCPVEIVIRRLSEGIKETPTDRALREIRLFGLNLLRKVTLR